LEKTLLKNYEICCEKGSAQWHLSPEDVVRCAVRMEEKALRSCMVVILYQRAMTRMVSINLTGYASVWLQSQYWQIDACLLFKNINVFIVYSFLFCVIADTFAEKWASDHTGCFLEVLSTTLVWPLLPHPDLNPSLFWVMTLFTMQNYKF